jgi:gamma-glutamylcyclotransferase (GGCT)/AIG2-like uncharacterized protein YtfP
MDAGGPTRLLFTYGTLRRGAPMHALLEGAARYLGIATFRGRLWDLGAYPGVTDSRAGGGRVRGELYELAAADAERQRLLDLLDRYEGEAFERAEREITSGDGERRTAYLYLFQGSTREARRIRSGDYVADLTRADPAARRG